MRFHIGRRFGKTYAGMSFGGGGQGKKSSTDGKHLLYFLLIPFFFVFPFVWLVQHLSGKPLKMWKLVIIWIFFFPILGMVAFYKSNLNKNIKIGVTAVVAVLCVISVIIPGDDTAKEEALDVMEIEAPAPAVTEAPTKALVATPVETPAPTEEPANVLAAELTAAPAPEPTVESVPVAAPSEPIQAGYVDADGLNLRAEPSREGALLGEYTRGETLEIVGEPGEWVHVRIGGQDGYMLAEYVGMGQPPEEEKEASEAERAPEREPEAEPVVVSPTEPPEPEYEIVNPHNYHGHVYTGGDNSTKYHYEAECAGKYSHEIMWEDVRRLGLEPCKTCVLQ